jgi:glycosyltransferase involved in cell wall biosynthesis
MEMGMRKLKSENHIDISLILPAYNEEDTIDKVVARVDRVLEETRLSYELIIVDDGSHDATRRMALNCSQNQGNLKVIGYDVNMGKGHAIRKGFSQSCGDVVVFFDSDLDIAPSQIIWYTRALKQGDLVVASKRHPQSVVEVPFLRRFLSYGFNTLVKLLTGLRIRDTQTGLKAVRRKALEPVFKVLTVRRFAFDVELLVVANLFGLKTIELPVNLRLTNILFNPFEVWRMFIDLLGITYRLRVLKWYQQRLNKFA